MGVVFSKLGCRRCSQAEGRKAWVVVVGCAVGEAKQSGNQMQPNLQRRAGKQSQVSVRVGLCVRGICSHSVMEKLC